MTDAEVCQKYLAKLANATDRKINFELSFKRFKQLMLQKNCFYTNKPFGPGADAKTLDRKDNNIGYTDANTVACTRYINNAKNNLTVNDILLLAKKLKPQNKNK